MINRRHLITGSLNTLAGLTLNNIQASNLNKIRPAAPLELKVYATKWGFTGDYAKFCMRAKQSGYDGIEVWLPPKNKVNSLLSAVEKYDLEFALLVSGNQSNFEENLTSYQQNLRTACQLDTPPTLVNCHTGRDYFNFQQASAFFKESSAQAKRSGILITHETHRARILFAAHITAKYLSAFKDLRLTLDISHWCAVASSLLADQAQNVQQALSRSDHVHSRVGYQQGPQVSDPRAPEWKQAFDAHLAWWDKVVDIKRRTTNKLTMTAEFGPFPYMPSLPYTKLPLGNQWEINRFMMEFWRDRYSP